MEERVKALEEQRRVIDADLTKPHWNGQDYRCSPNAGGMSRRRSSITASVNKAAFWAVFGG
jgi:hypothetical protein